VVVVVVGIGGVLVGSIVCNDDDDNAEFVEMIFGRSNDPLESQCTLLVVIVDGGCIKSLFFDRVMISSPPFETSSLEDSNGSATSTTDEEEADQSRPLKYLLE